MQRHVILYTDEQGFWITECPSLPGCGSDGETREEALSNIKDAIEGYIEALAQDELPIPELDSHCEIVTVDV